IPLTNKLYYGSEYMKNAILDALEKIGEPAISYLVHSLLKEYDFIPEHRINDVLSFLFRVFSNN
ncbi:MAG: hypothetical protein ACFFBD_28350, partial [Candidatus Hodarchaeota archaeon]